MRRGDVSILVARHRKASPTLQISGSAIATNSLFTRARLRMSSGPVNLDLVRLWRTSLTISSLVSGGRVESEGTGEGGRGSVLCSDERFSTGREHRVSLTTSPRV